MIKYRVEYKETDNDTWDLWGTFDDYESAVYAIVELLRNDKEDDCINDYEYRIRKGIKYDF